MTVKDFLGHLDGLHELAFYDMEEKYIFSCNSDSVILDEVREWSVMSFRTSGFHPVNERAGLRIMVSRDMPLPF